MAEVDKEVSPGNVSNLELLRSEARWDAFLEECLKLQAAGVSFEITEADRAKIATVVEGLAIHPSGFPGDAKRLTDLTKTLNLLGWQVVEYLDVESGAPGVIRLEKLDNAA